MGEDYCKVNGSEQFTGGCNGIEEPSASTTHPLPTLATEGRGKPTVEIHDKELLDVHISIKSTAKYHLTRLPLLALTWLNTVPSENVHIVTDSVDAVTNSFANQGYHLYYSSCPVKHLNSALACKCGDEFELYYKANVTRSWYCHVDDDMYVNSLELQRLLSALDPNDKHYLGRWSVNKDTRIKPYIRDKSYLNSLKRDSYYFATGAIYCISNGLMKEMEGYVSGSSRLMKTAKAIGAPDDMAIGFVIEAVLGYNMTNVKTLNSHLNPLHSLSLEKLPKQITISYSDVRLKQRINLPSGVFTTKEDPTRFLSYHCLLYPSVSWCQTPLIAPTLDF